MCDLINGIGLQITTWHFPVDGLHRVTSLLIDWIGVHRATTLRFGVCTNPEMGGLCINSDGSTIVTAALTA